MVLVFLLSILTVVNVFSFKFLKPKYSHDYYFNFRRNFNNHNDKSIGDLNNIYFYIKSNHKNIKLCISGLKKPGEKFTIDPQKHIFFFNSFSGYIMLEKLMFKDFNVNKIIIGNFKLGSGQGLVFNHKKDSLYYPLDPIKIFKKQCCLKQCISHHKRKFLGIATELEYRGVELCLFVSKNYLDAYLKNENIYTAKIREKYVNKNLLSRRNEVYNYTGGFSFSYRNEKKFDIGMNMIYTRFNKKFKLCNNSDFKDSLLSDMDNLFYGDTSINISIFNNFLIEKMKIYWEYARSFNDFKDILFNYGSALVLGCKFRFNMLLKYVCLVRYYSKDYHNFYGNGFGSGKGLVYKNFKGCMNNEIGICNGFQIKLRSNLVMKFVIDLCVIPKKTFTVTSQYRTQFIFNLKYNLSIFEYILFQCKYINSKSDIVVNNIDYYKNIYEFVYMKINVKKNIFQIRNNSNIILSIKPEKEKVYFGVCFHEKVSFNIWRFKNVIHFSIIKASDKSPIYLFKTAQYNFNKKIKFINENLFNLILNPKLIIKNNLLIDFLCSLKFSLKKKIRYQFSISLRYFKT